MNIELTNEEAGAIAHCIVATAIPRNAPLFRVTDMVLNKMREAAKPPEPEEPVSE